MTDPLPCPECGADLRHLPDEDGIWCAECGWDDLYEVEIEDLPPMAYTVEGFRSFYQRPPGVPVAPHSLGPATGIQWLELGRVGRAALG